jgi:antirestriction protein ArdC
MNYNNPLQGNPAGAFAIISEYTIKLLEKGIVPWEQPWNSYGIPRNVSSGYLYNGWNAVFLNTITRIQGYKTPLFLTFNQTRNKGGKIKRGEKGYPIVLWQNMNNQYTSVGNREETDRTYSRSRTTCTTYWVFNIDQTENIAFDMPLQARQKSPLEKTSSCQTLIEGVPNCPPIRDGHMSAYCTMLDYIQIPAINKFKSVDHYYSHLFHMLAYSTGHQSRLGRKDVTENEDFKQLISPKEVLTAEITIAMLCVMTGIIRQPTANKTYNPTYWCKQIRDNKTLILKASSQAIAAIDYLLYAQPSGHSLPHAFDDIATAS